MGQCTPIASVDRTVCGRHAAVCVKLVREPSTPTVTPSPGLEMEGVQLRVANDLINSVPLGQQRTTIPQLQRPLSASPGDSQQHMDCRFVAGTVSVRGEERSTAAAETKVEKHLRILVESGASCCHAARIVRGLDMLCRATRSTPLLLARASLRSCLQTTLGHSLGTTRLLATATQNNNMSRHSTVPTTAGAGAGGAGAGDGTGLGAKLDVSCGVAACDAFCPPAEAPELLNLGCGFPGTDINRAHTVPVLQRAMAALTADADRLERFMQVRYCRFLLLLLPCL